MWQKPCFAGYHPCHYLNQGCMGMGLSSGPSLTLQSWPTIKVKKIKDKFSKTPSINKHFFYWIFFLEWSVFGVSERKKVVGQKFGTGVDKVHLPMRLTQRFAMHLRSNANTRTCLQCFMRASPLQARGFFGLGPRCFGGTGGGPPLAVAGWVRGPLPPDLKKYPNSKCTSNCNPSCCIYLFSPKKSPCFWVHGSYSCPININTCVFVNSFVYTVNQVLPHSQVALSVAVLRYPRNVPPPPAPCHSELARQAFIILSSCILRLRGFNVHKVGVVGSFDRQVDPDPPATSKRTWAGKIFFRSIKKI